MFIKTHVIINKMIVIAGVIVNDSSKDLCMLTKLLKGIFKYLQ